ncbi:hypothetical protein BD769DRAFT_1660540 [Suillus cothurnatus]|nr:hypothetical protein BD769DRAFT_1660540 [Suillus cothurnatus]
MDAIYEADADDVAWHTVLSPFSSVTHLHLSQPLRFKILSCLLNDARRAVRLAVIDPTQSFILLPLLALLDTSSELEGSFTSTKESATQKSDDLLNSPAVRPSPLISSPSPKAISLTNKSLFDSASQKYNDLLNSPAVRSSPPIPSPKAVSPTKDPKFFKGSQHLSPQIPSRSMQNKSRDFRPSQIMQRQLSPPLELSDLLQGPRTHTNHF